MRLGEEHVNADGTGEVVVTSHLTSLIPCQRSAQLDGHALEQFNAARQHVLGAVATGQVAEQIQSAGPVDEGDDG